MKSLDYGDLRVMEFLAPKRVKVACPLMLMREDEFYSHWAQANQKQIIKIFNAMEHRDPTMSEFWDLAMNLYVQKPQVAEMNLN